MENNNNKIQKKFGFVRTSNNSSDKGIIYSKNAEDYIHVMFLDDRNLYFCTGKTHLYKEKIPAPYNLYEFTEFYKKYPPRITNNKFIAINSLDEVFFVYD